MYTRTIIQSLMTLSQLCILTFQVIQKVSYEWNLNNEIILYLNVALTCISILMLIYKKYVDQYIVIYSLYNQLLVVITVESVIDYRKEISLMTILVQILLFETLNADYSDKYSKGIVFQKIISIIYISLRLTIPQYKFRVEIIIVWIQVAIVVAVILIFNRQQYKKELLNLPIDNTRRQTQAQIKQEQRGSNNMSRKDASISIKKDNSMSHSIRKDQSAGDLLELRARWYDEDKTDIFTKIIDQFPAGVAILKFQSNRRPFVEYCNDTIKTLLKFEVHGQLLKKISELKRQRVLSNNEQSSNEEVHNIYKTSISKFESFSYAHNDKNLGVVKRFLKTGSDHLIQTPSKCQYSRFLKSQNQNSQSKENLQDYKKNVYIQTYFFQIFKKELHHLCIQIFKPAVQNYLMKLKQIFELYTIFDGYFECEDLTERCIEIKLFMSFQNNIPQILLLARDVSHRDHIKLLQQHNKAMSNQLNFVSHEYRTPLSCIITMLEMCLEDELSRKHKIHRSNSILVPETKLKFIQVALQNCRYLSNLSNDLLDLALIKVGKFKLRKQTFDLKETLEGCLDMFNILAEKKGIILKLEYPQNLQKMIFQDNNRVQQIVVNLLGNAFKFTLNGSITIEVKSGQHNLLTICVSDTGVGIKDEDKMNLFIAFGRIDSDENKKLNRQGVGLGLLISNMISRSLNQEQEGIKFISEFRKGTSFYFDLDCGKTIDEESWNQGSAKKTPKKSSLSPQKLCSVSKQVLRSTSIKEQDQIFEQQDGIPFEDSPQQIYFRLHKVNLISNIVICQCAQILVVDDNQFNIDVLQILLLKRNIPLIEFTISGDMTLSKLRQRFASGCCKTYKLIFLDLEMPDMSGLQAFKLMRELFEKHHTFTPVIACSGYHKDTLKEKCLISGMQDYLEKPVNKKELDRILQEYYY